MDIKMMLIVTAITAAIVLLTGHRRPLYWIVGTGAALLVGAPWLFHNGVLLLGTVVAHPLTATALSLILALVGILVLFGWRPTRGR